jgi:serine/threonine protein phosphatase PrpC
MEDADTARIGLPNGFDNWSFFGVFDGHAGDYVGLGFLSKLTKRSFSHLWTVTGTDSN